MRFGFAFLFPALLVLLAPNARADALHDSVTAREALVAAAVPDALPLAARDASGALVGFDIEVAREIAKRLGRAIRFTTPGWNAILSGGWGGKWNFSVSNITPTDDRGRLLDFPSVYRFEAVVVVVHKDNTSISTAADVSKMRVGVAQGTTFEQYLNRNLTIYSGDAPPDYLIDAPAIRPYPNKATALTALARRDGTAIDAVVTSFSTAQAAIDTGLPLRIVTGFLFWEPVAVAVDKGNDAFAHQIEEAVEAMMADGTLSALSVKWFGIDMTAPIVP